MGLRSREIWGMLGLPPVPSVFWMSALVLHHRDPNSVRSNLSEVDDIRETLHQRPTEVLGDDHPPTGRRSDPKHLPLELVDELSSKTG